MNPGIIRADRIHAPAQISRLVRWFQANGLRHHIPANARIIFTGNRLIIPTFDVERIGQKRTNWAAGLIRLDAYGDFEIPVKIRTYRVRVPFEAIK